MLRLTAGACSLAGMWDGEERLQEGLRMGKIRSLNGVSCGERPALLRRARKSKILMGAELGSGQWQG